MEKGKIIETGTYFELVKNKSGFLNKGENANRKWVNDIVIIFNLKSVSFKQFI